MNPAGRSRSSAAVWPLQEVAEAAHPERGERVERRAFLSRIPPAAGRAMASPADEQVQVDTDQPLGCLAAHRVGDDGAHVATLGDVAGVAEAVHQLRPGLPDAAGVPADLGRLAREAVAGQRRQHEVERVLGASALRGRVGERTDDLEQLDDRAGPAVRHDQRQRVRVLRFCSVITARSVERIEWPNRSLQSPKIIAKFGRIPLAIWGSIDVSLTALGLSPFFGGVQSRRLRPLVWRSPSTNSGKDDSPKLAPASARGLWMQTRHRPARRR